MSISGYEIEPDLKNMSVLAHLTFYLHNYESNKSNIIKAEFYRTSSLVRFDKVWLDGSLIWDSASNSEPYYKLIE